MLKKLICFALAAAIIAGLSACSQDKSKTPAPPETLKISYNSAKYGDDWIKALVAAYKKQNANVNVILDGDNLIDSKIGFSLLEGSDEPDIAFVSQTNWQTWADGGYIHDLTGLFAGKTADGITFSDKLQPGIKGYCEYKGKDYIVPWGDGVAGFIYNEKLFNLNKWEIPTTTAGLLSLIEKIKAQDIAPFVWSGQNLGYWDTVVKNWWAQAEGEAGMQAYLKMDSPDVYRQNGRLKALTMFQNIIKDPKNSVDNPAGIDAQKAIAAFYDDKAAMMPGGYYTLMETKYRPASNFKMQMMPLPLIDGAQKSSIGCALAGDFAFIPSHAKNIKQAENFLNFMAGNQALELFTQKTGSPAPFVYNPTLALQIDRLAASEAELWRGSTKIYMYSKNPVYYNEFFDWPCGGSPIMQIYSGGLTAQEAFDLNVEYAASNWADAKARYSGK